ncbi:hypothetical protein AGMMS49983_15530 [Clostridia bacterium]|nr:hypothetical protein AGMMS49983_15530 [Clostridia bacterium]
MITGKETNTVYLSERLYSDSRFGATCENLLAILDKHNINHKFLNKTNNENDVWCRDYMPVQVSEDKYMRFLYEPWYLNDKKGRKISHTDPAIVCQANEVPYEFSPINLDGGNVVTWSDRVIISDRIFDENPEYTDKKKLISKIEKLLEAEVIVIPQINDDMTGHADGMVRFIDGNTLIGSSRKEEYKYWTLGMNKVLEEYGMKYIDVPFLSNNQEKNQLCEVGYINYLEVQNLIVMPIFEAQGGRDDEAIALFRDTFPNRKIETINYSAIAREGGLLNCTTWTVRE